MEEEAPGLEYLCGTMIELPRAALRADEIAEVADFFSFGTNDLTQTTLGMSRDDAEGKFLTFYLEDGVLERNPFEVLDQDGVGDLMRIGVERGRSDEAGHQARHLRRARRRAELGRVLPPDRPRLRELLPVPRPARAPRGGAGRAEGSEARPVRPGRRLSSASAACRTRCRTRSPARWRARMKGKCMLSAAPQWSQNFASALFAAPHFAQVTCLAPIPDVTERVLDRRHDLSRHVARAGPRNPTLSIHIPPATIGKPMNSSQKCFGGPKEFIGAEEIGEAGDDKDDADDNEDPPADLQRRADAGLIAELWRLVGHRGEDIALGRGDIYRGGGV